MAGALKRQLDLAMGLAAALPKAFGKAAGGPAATTPQVLGSLHPASLVSAALRSGTLTMGTDGQKSPVEAAGRVMGNMAQAIVGSSAQSSVEAANDVFAALGIQIRIIQPSSPNARVHVGIVAHGGAMPAAVAPQLAPSEPMTPSEFVKFMREARNAGSVCGANLDTYVARLVTEGQLDQVPLLPSSFQQKLYIDVARIIVFAFQRACLRLDNAELWGHKLQVSMMSNAASFDGQRFRRRRSVVGTSQLRAIVDNMLETQAVHISLLPRPIERRLYMNCMKVVFMLLEDLLTGENEGISFMGHRIRFHLDVQPVELVQRMLEEQPVTHCRINEQVISELVEELLADEVNNFRWVPDAIERQWYVSAMRLLIRIAEHIVCRLQLSVLGREIKMSILSHMDVRRRVKEKQRRRASQMQVKVSEEENPLRTLSTYELEERLKDLDAQRRVLQALHDLGGASFDLTQETPMLTEGCAESGGATSATSPTVSAGQSAQAGSAGEGHEFQRLAHTLKLARSLSQAFEVDADIDVPYSMIADVEAYPLWMPWCTSGKVVGAPTVAAECAGATADGPSTAIAGEPAFGQEGAGASGAAYFDSLVGFGFETGTFLGTVGDTVSYRMFIQPPTPSGDGGEVPHMAAVRADALNGFTYGKRLVYDWRFTSLGDRRTRVELDMLFQAHNVLYMPIWDSMQHMVVNNMLSAFRARAEKLQRSTQRSPPQDA